MKYFYIEKSAIDGVRDQLNERFLLAKRVTGTPGYPPKSNKKIITNAEKRGGNVFCKMGCVPGWYLGPNCPKSDPMTG